MVRVCYDRALKEYITIDYSNSIREMLSLPHDTDVKIDHMLPFVINLKKHIDGRALSPKEFLKSLIYHLISD